MICKLIGLGAAGNKAAITAVDERIISIENVMLINSTLKDIPADFQNKDGANVYQFINAYGGCGKERSMSNDLCMATLEADTIRLNKFLNFEEDTEAELVIIIASTEGGTGSGAAPVIANYILNVLGIPVHVFGIAGFEDDVRGMRNTIEFFKEMSGDFTVECIKNSRFLSQCNGNKIKAEKAANKEFCKKIGTLMGLTIRDSEHNIDPTDLYKITTDPGYMIIETCTFTDKIKNRDQFRQALIDTIDNSKALDIDTQAISKLGVIINIREDSTDFIDYLDVLKDRFGIAEETYEHIQHESDMPEFISFIATGLRMPIEEVEGIYKKYDDSAKKVNRDADPFFSTIKEKDVSNGSSFSFKKQRATQSKNEFFKRSAERTATKAFNNTQQKVVSRQVEPPTGINNAY